MNLDRPLGVKLTLLLEWDGEYWVGVCNELGTSTYGSERAQVEHELDELVVHELNELEADGERENFFTRHGIEVYAWTEPVSASLEDPGLTALPLPFWASLPSYGTLAATHA